MLLCIKWIGHKNHLDDHLPLCNACKCYILCVEWLGHKSTLMFTFLYLIYVNATVYEVAWAYMPP